MEEKIIVIEHEPDIQKMITQGLSGTEFELKIVEDGQAGLELVKKEKPCLILLNPYLPRLDGFDFLKKLKEDKSLQDIPVLFLVHLENLNEIERILRLGNAAYLIKEELNQENILEAVKQIIINKN